MFLSLYVLNFNAINLNIMRSSKTKLTYLISKIAEKLVEGDDIYGYPGINKAQLVKSLEDSRDLLSCFRDYNSMFEVVFLKRNIASIYEKCMSFLSESEINTDNFNDFLKNINLIRAEIKITYILVSQNPLRLDSEIAKSKELLEEFNSTLNEISVAKEEILSAKTEAQEIIESLTAENEIAEGNSAKLDSLIENLESSFNRVEEKALSVENWSNEISDCEQSISSNEKKSTEILDELNAIKNTINKHQLQIEEQVQKQKEIIARNEDHQKEIKATLEGANKHGLAGSFYTRKRELLRMLWLWGAGAVLSIIALVLTSYLLLIVPILENQNDFSITTYLSRIPIFGAIVWLGWFCAKQYGYSIRIREEYAFKYAISMAFEGYKKEAIEVNKEMLDQLLKLTLDSISISPVHCYDSKTNHATPINEITEGIIKEIKPIISDLAKLKGE